MRSNDLMCTYHMTIVMCAVISKWGQHPAARQDYYALNPDLSLDMARGVMPVCAAHGSGDSSRRQATKGCAPIEGLGLREIGKRREGLKSAMG